ncbi:MAG: aspartate/glutamate racemase family protein [Chloroflexota bacterium]|nr:aspartate/glutamate racemase family protein [Chloroflexota bacterium]
MRIWCQSCTGIGADPLWQNYDKSLKEHVKKVGRPDTHADFFGQGETLPGIDRYRSTQHICAHRSIQNAIRAEKEGYDAFLMVSTIDAGFYEIKELVDIPVVMITESVLHLCCLLAPKFSFITHNEALLHLLNRLTKEYGLEDHLVPGGHLDLSYQDIKGMYEKPEPYIDGFTKLAKQIAARGANLLFPAALIVNQWCIDKGIKEIDGATVIDVMGAGIKMTELMVDLQKMGVPRSKSGAYMRPPGEVKAAIKKLYG